MLDDEFRQFGGVNTEDVGPFDEAGVCPCRGVACGELTTVTKLHIGFTLKFHHITQPTSAKMQHNGFLVVACAMSRDLYCV